MTDGERNHLDITAAERAKLRSAGIRKADIHHHTIAELQEVLKVSKIRAMELSALSEFQSLPSIGIRFAHDLISMGFFSLKDLRSKDGAKLTDEFERQVGAWADPCVEDQFRLVVHYARHPDSHRNWWDFTAERKEFRRKHGYPPGRPMTPWFELPQYSRRQLPEVKSQTTKAELRRRLKKAVALMKKDPSAHFTLKQMAEAAHLSSYHFLRSFKGAFLKTPFQYLAHLRLKMACRLLREKSLPISMIAPRCGFENESSFTRLFKREFRITPTSFRAEFGKKKRVLVM